MRLVRSRSAVVLIVLGLVVAAPARAGAAPLAPPDPLATPARLERWRDDLHALAAELPRRHPRLYWRTPEREFRRQLDSLERAVPSSPDWLLTAGIARVCALADAHTGLQWGDAATRFQRLPIQFARFDDGWRVVAADSTHAALLGARLTGVGVALVDRAAGALAPFFSSENEAWRAEKLAVAFTCPELIAAAGLADSPGRVVLRFEDARGALIETTLAPVAPLAGESRAGWVTVVETRALPVPIARREPQRAYRFALLPESRTLLFRYNACVEIDTLPFARFAARLWAAADSAAVTRVVVDLRANTGGNSRVWEPFVRGLLARPALADKSRLRVLISSRTYSSAVLDAWELRTRATLIGQPTGGRPNGWGEIKSFRLPHSRLDIQYSTRYFRLERDADPPSLMPDVEVPVRWADFLAGRDAALERALER